MKNTQNKWCYDVHSHSFHELHVILNGNCKMKINDKYICMTENSYIIIDPDSCHKLCEHSEDFFRFSVAFDCLGNNVQNILSFPTLPVKLAQKNLIFINTMLQENENQQIGSSNIKNALTQIILTEILRTGRIIKREKNSSLVLSKAVTFNNNNISQGIVVKDVANSVFLGVRQLDRLFMKNFSLTTTQYIRAKKIIFAKEYLRNTGISVKEISFLVGFI